jgi:hypothetical protein
MKLFITALKKVFPLLLVCNLFFISCQKDAGINPAVVDSHITAIYAQDSHYLRVDSLIYDSNGRIVKIFESNTDTTSGVTNPYTRTTTFTFTFSGGNSVPSSYIYTYTNSTNSYTYMHNLYYDSQNRIKKDSLLNATPSSLFAAVNYYYGNNLIVYDIIYKTDSGLLNIQRDSLILNASANVIADNFYYLDYYNQPVIENDLATFSNYANPLYEKTLATTLGPLLREILGEDFISSNLLSSLTFISPQLSPFNLTYTWTTDAKGRVIKGVELTGNYGYAFHYSN